MAFSEDCGSMEESLILDHGPFLVGVWRPDTNGLSCFTLNFDILRHGSFFQDLPDEDIESSDSEFAAYEEESEEEEDSSALSGSDLNNNFFSVCWLWVKGFRERFGTLSHSWLMDVYFPQT